MSVIKIFKGGSLDWLTAFFFLSFFFKINLDLTFDLSTVQRGVDGKLDAAHHCLTDILRV